MRVLITGATGFVGRPLVARLLRGGHEVTAWVRSKEAAARRLGTGVRLVAGAGLADGVGRADAVVNLAGEPVLPRRWTPARKAALAESRVGTTRALVAAMEAASRRPRALVSASAVGFYGDRGGEPLEETEAAGADFLARLCADWEAAATAARALGVRVAILRIGIVLGRDGGALAPQRPLYKLGLGGPLGSGRQYVSWIHLDDLVEALAIAVEDERYEGPINAVAPNPVPQRELARGLGAALGRPAVLPTPRFALELALGEAAQALLASQRGVPRRLLALGFPFRFPELGPALADVLGPSGARRLEPREGAPGAAP